MVDLAFPNFGLVRLQVVRQLARGAVDLEHVTGLVDCQLQVPEEEYIGQIYVFLAIGVLRCREVEPGLIRQNHIAAARPRNEFLLLRVLQHYSLVLDLNRISCTKLSCRLALKR